MKANKFFAIAFAALTMVGLNACKDKNNGGDGNEPTKPGQEAELALNPTSLQLEVGQEGTITATIEVSFESSNPAAATVTPANDGKSAKVTAVAEGNAIITAKSQGGQTKTCVVAVKKAGGEGGGGNAIVAKRIWPVVLDGVTAEANASLIAGDFRVNDVDNFLYIWSAGETYVAGEGKGLNYFGNSEGYVALQVAPNMTWSGGGICITNADAITAIGALKEAIVANPDKFFFHVGMKATTNGTHQLSIFDDAEFFNIGTEKIDGKGEIIGDFERDGAWHGFDIPMSQFVNVIANSTVKSGMNIMCFRSGAVSGSQLNLDAVYFYEKE